MISINANLGPLQALELQVAARSDPTAKTPDGLRARDTGSPEPAKPRDDQTPTTLANLVPQPHHEDFMSRIEAIMRAHENGPSSQTLSTEAARLQALQIRQQLESQTYGISHRASQIALALFR